jgi:hypothetical protein
MLLQDLPSEVLMMIFESVDRDALIALPAHQQKHIESGDKDFFKPVYECSLGGALLGVTC